MGRIKGTIVKRTAKEVMAKFKSEVSPDFEKNKQFLKRIDMQKKTRNSVAGYIARKVKKEIEKENKKNK
jgi:small subunit ribosomal protein S17e